MCLKKMSISLIVINKGTFEQSAVNFNFAISSAYRPNGFQ